MSEPNLHGIRSFGIEKLFGNRNVFIPFDNNLKVLIGENGLGKTSILNALYYTLTCKFSKLNAIVFDKIILEFTSGDIIEIQKDDLLLSEDEERLKLRHESRIGEYLMQLMTDEQKQIITENITSDDFKSKRIVNDIVSGFQKQIGYPPQIIRRALFIMFSGRAGKLEEIKTKITKELKAEILYFPTYRRIEEELHKLGSTEEIKLPQDDKRLIQFGMEDVNSTFTKVIETIRTSAILGFSAITGEMLSQYLEGTPHLDHNIKEQIKPDVLKIVLERVGENITSFNKGRIMQLVSSNEIFENDDYRYLVNFLSKLVKIYDQQKGMDNSIKNFESICNGYLRDKKVVYNESKVTINVIQEKNQQPIQLRHLSSGEKQIISLFARIFLDSAENIFVLFDEPELSLSIEWQKRLLPDILKSNKCNLLFSVTHSPFIFDNELDTYAEDMDKYVTEI